MGRFILAPSVQGAFGPVALQAGQQEPAIHGDEQGGHFGHGVLISDRAVTKRAVAHHHHRLVRVPALVELLAHGFDERERT